MLEVNKPQQGMKTLPEWTRNFRNLSIDLVWSYEEYQIRFTCLASVYDTCLGGVMW